MSWDIKLEDSNGNELEDCEWNYTYNTSPMMYAVDFDLHDLDDKKCEDVVYKLWLCIEALATDPEKFEAMNPENGWGSYDGLLEVLIKMHKEFRINPYAIIRASF